MILPLLTCALLAPVAARGSETPTHGRAAVFGRVVGGWDTLAKIEKIPTDHRRRTYRPVFTLGLEVLE